MDLDRSNEIAELDAFLKSVKISKTKAGLWARELVLNCNIDTVALLEHEVLSGNLESVFGSMQCPLKASAVELDFIRRHFKVVSETEESIPQPSAAGSFDIFSFILSFC